MRINGLNYSDYVEDLMNRYGMNENDAERQADADFDLLGDTDICEPIIDLAELWDEAEDRISEKLAIEGGVYA